MAKICTTILQTSKHFIYFYLSVMIQEQTIEYRGRSHYLLDTKCYYAVAVKLSKVVTTAV